MREDLKVVIYDEETLNIEVPYNGELCRLGDVHELEMAEFGLTPLEHAAKLIVRYRRYMTVHDANKIRLENYIGFNRRQAEKLQRRNIVNNEVNFEKLMPILSVEQREELLNGDIFYKGEVRPYRGVVLQELAERGITIEEFERLRRFSTHMSSETLENADDIRLTQYKERSAMRKPHYNVRYEENLKALMSAQSEEELNREINYKGETLFYHDVILQELAARSITLEDFQRLLYVGCRIYSTLEEADKARLTKYKESQEEAIK